MEYVYRIIIFGLKLIVKSGLETIIWNSSMRKHILLNYFFLIQGKNLAQKYKFINKKDLFYARRNFKENLCGLCTYNKWHF